MKTTNRLKSDLTLRETKAIAECVIKWSKITV